MMPCIRQPISPDMSRDRIRRGDAAGLVRQVLLRVVGRPMLTDNKIESDVVVSDTLARLGVSSKVACGNLPRGLPLAWGRVGLSRSGWLHTCSGV